MAKRLRGYSPAHVWEPKKEEDAFEGEFWNSLPSFELFDSTTSGPSSSSTASSGVKQRDEGLEEGQEGSHCGLTASASHAGGATPDSVDALGLLLILSSLQLSITVMGFIFLCIPPLFRKYSKYKIVI